MLCGRRYFLFLRENTLHCALLEERILLRNKLSSRQVKQKMNGSQLNEQSSYSYASFLFVYTITQPQPVSYVTSSTLSDAETISAILSQSDCRLEGEFLDVRVEKNRLLVDPPLSFE